MKLITHLTNLQHLINFTGSSGFLLMGKSKNFFFTDFRYREIAQKLEKSKTRLPFTFVEMGKDFDAQLKKAIGRNKSLEFEEEHLSVAKLKSWKKHLQSLGLTGLDWKPLKNTIEQSRLIKDAEEIKLMKKSQKINEETLHRTQKLFKTGVTEQELAWKIKVIGHELGAEDISFEPIVAFGPNSAIPHHHPTKRKLKAKDVILIDMGMKYKGYCSDMTRCFFQGKATNEQQAVYQKVLDAQLAAIKACKAGIKASKLDQIVRELMGEDAQHFGHSLGHGIGLDVHESPNLSSRSKDTLKEGMVVTVEPGIYLPGKFGIRIEDMGRVTKTGYDNFTGAGK